MQDEGTQVIDGTAEEIHEDDDRPVEPTAAGVELVLQGTPAGQIIRAEEPDEIIAKATAIANSLKKLIDGQDLAKALGGSRKHVEVGGWQAAGTLLGALGGQPLHAETEWSRIACLPNGDPLRREYEVTEWRGKGDNRVQRIYTVDGYDWEAKVKIKTPDGTVVGTAEALCSRTESTWAERPDPAVKSMAETRAESRAYRRAIGWIAHMAGYNPTPAEEMNGDDGKLPSWAEPANEQLLKNATLWVKSITGGNGAAKALWESMLPEEGAPMPGIVALAICLYGKACEEAVKRGAQDKAAEQPDPPAPEPTTAPAGEETGAGLPAGVCYVTDEAPSGLDPERARKITLDAARRVCTCPRGFDLTEADIANAPAAAQSDDACPMWNHGIPF